LLLDKPAGLTSFETIEKLRKIVGVKKVGHVGTLDPLATGLLLACLGKATKLAQFLSGWDKEYVAQIKLGATTDTWDRDGNLMENVDVSAVSLPEVSRAVSELTGEVALLAPEYSALKYQGKKLYEYARAGQKVPRPTKRVKIYSAEILEFSPPYLTLKINCSKGTYIRSIAFELGRKLGCGAAVWELRRTKLGPYSIEKALTLDKIQEIIKTQQLESHLISLPDAVGHFPRVILLPDGYQKVKHGLAFKPVDVLEFDSFQKDRWVRILDPAKQLLAVGRSLCDSTCFLNSPEQALIKYERVLIN